VLRKFIADYNRRFARQARESATAWRETPDTLDRICCFVHERIVSNDNVVQWEGRRFHAVRVSESRCYNTVQQQRRCLTW